VNLLGWENIKARLQYSCESKRALTEEEANVVVDKKAKKGIVWFYYRCDLCLMFHITSKEPNGIKGIKFI
jgi:hypothetical protein